MSIQYSAPDPLVTIAIPTFNRASWLKTCVISALSQTYPNFEVLVSNNASSDETVQVLSRFRDPRLRILTQRENIGLLPNWNSCVANAKGEYLLLVSDDDRLAPWILERCMALFSQHPRLPIVVALSNFHSTSIGNTWPARQSRRLLTGVYPGKEILLEYLNDSISVHQCSIMMRTDAVRAIGGFPLDFPHTADVATWASLLFEGDAGFVNVPCATFYSHGQSETARLGCEEIISDDQKVAHLMMRLAERHIVDKSERRRIQVHARRCFAQRSLLGLSDYRKDGGSLWRIISMLWRFRHELRHADVVSAGRFLTIITCPRPLAHVLRRMRRTVPEEWNASIS